jgi:Ca2+-binding RTX toxin-like protein
MLLKLEYLMSNKFQQIFVSMLNNVELEYSRTINADHFGADMLRFRDTTKFRESASELAVTNVRWPGEIIVDPTYKLSTDASEHRWVNSFAASGRVSEFVYDLTHPNIIDTVGYPREGLSEAMEYAYANSLGFTMLVPEDRYVVIDPDASDPEKIFTLDLVAAKRDISIFLERLFQGAFGDVPLDFTLQIGQEYYTGQVDYMTRYFDLDHDARVKAVGQLYNELVKHIAVVTEELTSQGLNPFGIDPRTLVHMGRLFGDYGFGDSSPYSGSVDDAYTLSEQFDSEGFEALDALLVQRYVPTWDGIEDGFAEEIRGHTLDDIVRLWESAAQDQGVDSKRFDVVAGWAVSSTIRQEIRQDYSLDVTQNDFKNRTDKGFEQYVQTVWAEKNVYGPQHASSMLQLFSHMAIGGATKATYYGVDLRSPGQLSGATVDGEIVTFAAGTLFENLANDLVGMRVNKSFLHNLKQDQHADGSYVVNINSFQKPDMLVVYAWVNDIPDEGLKVEIDFGPDIVPSWWFGEVEQTNFRTEVLTDWREKFGIPNLDQRWGTGFQTAESNLYLVSERDADGTLPSQRFDSVADGMKLEFTQDHEIIRIVFEKNPDTPFTGGLLPSGPVTLDGTDEADTIGGSEYADFIRGRAGDDRIGGNYGDDIIYGDAGNDRLVTQGGEVELYGGSGNDLISHSAGSSLIDGGSGDDDLRGGVDRDLMFGGHGDDQLTGRNGDDVLSAGGGDDTVFGGDGNDVLDGNRGNDELFGGDGNDILVAGDGDDFLTGDAGRDTFVFNSANSRDVIADFDASLDEVIEFRTGALLSTQQSFDDLKIVETRDGAFIETGSSTGISLLNVSVSDLTIDNFHFI